MKKFFQKKNIVPLLAILAAVCIFPAIVSAIDFTTHADSAGIGSSGANNWVSLATSTDGMKLAAIEDHGTGGSIFTSVNGGAMWTAQTIPPSRYWNAIVSSADGTRLAAVSAYSTDVWTGTLVNGVWAWVVTSVPSKGAGFRSIATDASGTRLVLLDTSDLSTLWLGTYASGTGIWSWAPVTLPTSLLGARALQAVASSANGEKIFALDTHGTLYAGILKNGAWAWSASFALPPDTGGSLASSLSVSADGTHVAFSRTGSSAFYTSTYQSDKGEFTWVSHGSGAWSGVAISGDGTKLLVTPSAANISQSVIIASYDASIDSWALTTKGIADTAHIRAAALSMDGSKMIFADGSEGYVYTSGYSEIVPVTQVAAQHASPEGVMWQWQPGSHIRAWAELTASPDGAQLTAWDKAGHAYASADGGATWALSQKQVIAPASSPIAPSDSHEWSSLAASHDGVMRIAIERTSGKLYLSKDSGTSWNEEKIPGALVWGPDAHWTSVTLSCDGSKFAAAASPGYVWTGLGSSSGGCGDAQPSTDTPVAVEAPVACSVQLSASNTVSGTKVPGTSLSNACLINGDATLTKSLSDYFGTIF